MILFMTQIGEKLQVIVCGQVVDAYFVSILQVVIDGKECRTCSFSMEIPMRAFGHFADKVKHKVRDFQVSQEIFENQWLVGVDE